MNTGSAPQRDHTRWRPGWMLAAPHRLAFSAAALMFGGSGLWWAMALIARSLGIEVPWALPPSIAHGLVMGLGFMPLFFAGFLFTAGPRWLQVPPVAARSLVSPLALQLAGWSWFLLAVHGPDATFAALFGAMGLAAVTFGWSWICWRFIGLLRASRAADRRHARVIAVAGVVGALALGGASVGLALGNVALVRAATLGALWGFVGVVFLAVSDRMLPFFDDASVRGHIAWLPRRLLDALLVLFAFEAAAAVAQALLGVLPPSLLVVQAACEGVAGLVLLGIAIHWARKHGLRFRLTVMLYVGFVWLGLAFLLASISNALAVPGSGHLSLGLAPLHSYAMGFLGSTLIAMVTRISCGHGGRSVVADSFVWWLFWLLQFAVLARVLAAILAAADADLAQPSNLIAAVCWSLVCLAWTLRYGRWYGRPRADGRPG